MGATIQIDQPGLLTSIQDLGRPGHLGMALSRGGGLDPLSVQLANLLVGNDPASAVLEITGLGPGLRFHQTTAIAWAGAPFEADYSVNGSVQGRLQSHRPVVVPKGALVRWLSPSRGFRAWIAFAGGIEAPVALASRSSHLAAQIGRPRLTKGQELVLSPCADMRTDRVVQAICRDALRPYPTPNGSLEARALMPRWSIPEQSPGQSRLLTVWAYPGRHWNLLGAEVQASLWETPFSINPQSNRQGIRLEGAAIKSAGLGSLPSEPVRLGTVQLPPDGNPVILLAEHQTTGGYPRILEVCSSMTQILAQAGPGHTIVFKPTSLDASQARLRQIDFQRHSLQTAIHAKLSL